MYYCDGVRKRTHLKFFCIYLTDFKNHGDKGSGLHGQNKESERDSDEINARIDAFTPGKSTLQIFELNHHISPYIKQILKVVIYFLLLEILGTRNREFP